MPTPTPTPTPIPAALISVQRLYCGDKICVILITPPSFLEQISKVQ
jgi:hypothetical protein